MKKQALLLTALSFGIFGYGLSLQAGERFARIEAPISAPAAGGETAVPEMYMVEGWAGSYLAGRYGQRYHDWSQASQYISRVLDNHPNDPLLIKRAMILAMGSGNTDMAFALAKRNADLDGEPALALIFLAAQAFHDKKYEEASQLIARIPEGDVTAFLIPMIRSWADASIGIYNANDLTGNTIHIHHAILIADFLEEHEHIEKLLKKALKNDDINAQDKMRVADLYAHIGQRDKALSLYEDAFIAMPENTQLEKKIEKLQAGKPMQIFRQIKTPEQGMAQAFHDTAQTLHLEYSDDSARLFAHIAHYLDPHNTHTMLLLSEIASRYELADEAIGYLRGLPKTDEQYINAQRRVAEILVEAERTEEALDILHDLAKKHDDPDFMIQIGDIHRNQEDFKSALKAYNNAAKMFDGDIPSEYWHLHYVRGIAYERLGQWDRAEKDLKLALSYEPDHPFVLNYLAYAWADQGVNLNESLNMLRTAVSMRPSDGYITDSLGWVLYRMGRFKESVPHLEKAVELLPYDPVINDHLGDAYWRVDRKLEARFQWERARNHAEGDEVFIESVEEKLDNGMPNAPIMREAKSGQISPQVIRDKTQTNQ